LRGGEFHKRGELGAGIGLEGGGNAGLKEDTGYIGDVLDGKDREAIVPDDDRYA
jgi:hypothetical protein